MLNRHKSYESFRSLQSLLPPEDTVNHDAVPPSSKSRIAQKMHLIPKTYYSLIDLETATRETIRSFKNVEKVFKKFSEEAEDIAKPFEADGVDFLYQLRELSGTLYEGIKDTSKPTIESLSEVAASCKDNRYLDRTYRKHIKAHENAVKHCNKCKGKTSQKDLQKLESVEREVDRKEIALRSAREEYDNKTMDVALRALRTTCIQTMYNADVITVHADKITGDKDPRSSSGSSTYQEGATPMFTPVPDVDQFDIPASSVPRMREDERSQLRFDTFEEKSDGEMDDLLLSLASVTQVLEDQLAQDASEPTEKPIDRVAPLNYVNNARSHDMDDLPGAATEQNQSVASTPSDQQRSKEKESLSSTSSQQSEAEESQIAGPWGAFHMND